MPVGDITTEEEVGVKTKAAVAEAAAVAGSSPALVGVAITAEEACGCGVSCKGDCVISPGVWVARAGEPDEISSG